MLSTERSGIAAHLSVCQNQYKIGMIGKTMNSRKREIKKFTAEMIHTASLVHDDVIDEANTRRGSASVNAVWGNKMVDFLKLKQNFNLEYNISRSIKNKEFSKQIGYCNPTNLFFFC